MEKKKKSVLEDALLQVDELKEAVKENAKGILQSTMKEELNDLLKEEKEESTKKSSSGDLKDLKNPKKELPEQEDEEDVPEDPEDNETDGDTESGEEVDSVDDETPLENEPELDDVEGEGMEDDDVLDMTGAPDDDVLRVFKSMKAEDGVVVKKDDENEIELGIDDEEYIIKLDDEGESIENEIPPVNDVPDSEDSLAPSDDLGDDLGDELGDEEGIETDDELETDDEADEELGEQDETVYEIELDDEFDDESDDDLKGDLSDDDFEIREPEDDDEIEGDVEEAMRTKSNIHGDKNKAQSRAGIKGKTMYKAGSNPINEEYKKLKKQNTEYKKALVEFKNKLQEIALFNSNLAYSTRLFTEHSTTKQEKLDILKRFDSVKSKKGSKNLFEQINKELGGKTTVTENVVDKITSTPKSSSKEVLSEQKAYENPQISRMKELMNKIN